MLATAAILLVLLTVRLVAWTLTRPVTMREIQYVARFRMPLLLQISAVVLMGGVGLILARLLVFATQALSLAFLVTIDDYTIRMAAYSIMLASAVVLSILYLSRFPRKLLVFPDHLRIKSLAYRSRVLRPEEVEDISTRRIHQVWLTKSLLRCVPLTFGLVGPGIYLRPTKGRAYFFRTRNNRELIDVLSKWRGEAVTPAKRKPSATVPAEPAQDKPKEQSAPDAPGPVPDDHREEIDYDDIGLTDAEMKELLGD
jgi:hypothetical protein